MNVVAFNGSPRKNGNTAQAIQIVLNELEQAGIETEIVHVGKEKLTGCIACMGCSRNQDSKCVLKGDSVNDWIHKMREADGILLGSPVYYSGVAGSMKSFLDRAFFVNGMNGNALRHKVGAAVAAVRRSGGIPTVAGLYHYLQYSEMMMPSANYWNVVHGLQPGEVEQDEEGVQLLQVLGRNMAYLMQVMELGKKSIPAPEPTDKVMTNFVR